LSLIISCEALNANDIQLESQIRELKADIAYLKRKAKGADSKRQQNLEIRDFLCDFQNPRKISVSFYVTDQNAKLITEPIDVRLKIDLEKERGSSEPETKPLHSEKDVIVRSDQRINFDIESSEKCFQQADRFNYTILVNNVNAGKPLAEFKIYDLGRTCGQKKSVVNIFDRAVEKPTALTDIFQDTEVEISAWGQDDMKADGDQIAFYVNGELIEPGISLSSKDNKYTKKVILLHGENTIQIQNISSGKSNDLNSVYFEVKDGYMHQNPDKFKFEPKTTNWKTHQIIIIVK
jgi:hypothetical protein